jgi:TrkA domain protein
MTTGGRNFGVVSYRTGRQELLLYDPDDLDTCQEVIRLTPEEADALAICWVPTASAGAWPSCSSR